VERVGVVQFWIDRKHGNLKEEAEGNRKSAPLVAVKGKTGLGFKKSNRTE